MPKLAPLLQAFRRTVASREPSGVAETGVPGVTFFWIDQETPRSPLLYDTGIVILGQGHKVGWLGGRTFRYDADTCLVLGVPVPFECASHGTPDEPLLGVRLDVDVGALHSLVARFAGGLGLEAGGRVALHSGVEPLHLDGPLLDATARLLASLDDPLDRQVVAPAAVEEILYRVLRTPQGRVLFHLTQHQTAYAQVARALERIHDDFRALLSVDDLARVSGMGVSSFHRAFKEVTGESPLQYLKKVRLLKAKALLVFEGRGVEEAAYEVGYASPSQFSREFKRYFAVPPSEARSLPYSDSLMPA
ncbi:MAG: AraC family transcriptional regulator [Alphaproteobacteria bacterium]|nr:AraC family transcriptional regulator [Alphaproteobacteria bacterium]